MDSIIIIYDSKYGVLVVIHRCNLTKGKIIQIKKKIEKLTKQDVYALD